MDRMFLKKVLALFTIVSLMALFTVFIVSCQKEGVQTEVIGFPQSFADLAAKVNPAVVNIATTTTVRIPGNPLRHFFGPNEKGSSFEEFFRHQLGDQPDTELKQSSLGSGFIIDKGGLRTD